MKIGATMSNLLYWNGADTTEAEVSFGPAPTADFSLRLYDFNRMDQAAADGTNQLVPGKRIALTADDGFIHQHDFFFLDNDHDDNNATVAADGVYLIALRLRMSALDRSDPFYIVWATPPPTDVMTAALAAAKSWVKDRVDLLAPNFAADFDGDLDVDGADFLTWQRGFGAAAALQIVGDADRDSAVTAADLAIWRGQFGSNLVTFSGAQAAATVPEPTGTASWLLIAALAPVMSTRSTRVSRR